jgi:hypothetical protein
VTILRLLTAFALAIAVPLQGLAGASCMCKTRTAQDHARSATVGAQVSTVPQALASAGHGPLQAPLSQAGKLAKKHACPSCAAVCCQAAAPAPSMLTEFDSPAPVGVLAPPVRHVGSWAEPVPDKPPRA